MDFLRKESFAQELERAKKEAAQAPKEPWESSIIKSLLSAKDLDGLKILQRALIMDDWFMEGDLGFIFASRGVGKTWLGIHLANCLSEARSCGPWKVHSAHKVLYLDGEMPIQDVQARNHALSSCTENLDYLSHEILFERTGRILNLADTELQNAILDIAKAIPYKIVILDNLSTLISGIEENKAIDWEKILSWLLKLRRSRIAVIFIHHSGVSPDRMRGTTKREDAATWILRLQLPRDDPQKEVSGAHFITSFEKSRNGSRRPNDIKWNFSPLPNGEMDVRFEFCSPLDTLVELVAAGVCEPRQIAEELNLSSATITRLAQKAEVQGLIEIKKRKYYARTSESDIYNPSDY